MITAGLHTEENGIHSKILSEENKLGGWRNGLVVRAHVALAEDQNSVPSTNTRQLSTVWDSNFR